ncbi:putative nuclease HARBI1 [Homarus americanus]|uniref:Nuclease HARBI1-like 19 n=1 Tax=Homarus americanus TaxID=6706 RepID=A0A8J5N6H6_HOMAM|nr:putative nuclease HARBI1 [Homarus americanus]KAG7174112.1 nuclease HARBI1-like 19 [Homarus americanus]
MMAYSLHHCHHLQSETEFMAELLVALAYRRILRRERTYRDPLDPLAVSDEHLIKHYKFPRQEILRLCEELRPSIERPTNRSHAIPCHTQVLVALGFYTSGNLQSSVGNSTGLSQTSVSRVINKVTDALFKKGLTEIRMPKDAISINKTKRNFCMVDNFPDVVGLIDCTHIPIKTPIANERKYVNQKNVHSLNIQVVCNSEMLIGNFVAKYPGGARDAFIWSNSTLHKRFEVGDFGDAYLLGDSDYPLQPFLLTPFHHPVTAAQERYNRSHKKTRDIIDKTFDILKSRFRCLHQARGYLNYEPGKC